MQTLQDIQQALSRLPPAERASVAEWLRLHFDADDGRVEEPAARYGNLPDAPHLTVEEYLELEERASIRHEYVAGSIFAMTGAALRHNVIGLNISTAFRERLRGGPCQVFMEAVKVHVRLGTDDAFYYPDVVVACGPLNMDDRVLEAPKLVIEVLSPSTEATDRREKAVNYRRIPELEEYVLVSQRKAEVVIHRRSEGWVPRRVAGRDAVAEFQSIDLRLAMQRIYESLEV